MQLLYTDGSHLVARCGTLGRVSLLQAAATNMQQEAMSLSAASDMFHNIVAHSLQFTSFTALSAGA